jgi:2-keto-4-pentenoate hydratase/2-oxohepta-3-ene-1,7-dioic acid hydratase in catechol pathway
VRLVTYQHEGKQKIGAARAGENGRPTAVVDLSAIAPDMVGLIELGAAGLEQAAAVVQEADARSPAAIPLADVTLLAPIPTPRRNIMCLGLNYAEHEAEAAAARGQRSELPQFPVIFTKATTAVNAPYADIPFDPAVSTQIDWEAELAIIIGRAGKNIPAAQAMAHVFGYTALNDVTARDIQWRHKQYFKGKSLDGCCPMGPWIVTADALPNPHDLHVVSRVNGVTKQAGHTSQFIFDIPTIVAELSRGMTLLPGDIISTGTPAGVGFARTPPEFLRPGDIVECEVSEIGVIRNRIVHV